MTIFLHTEGKNYLVNGPFHLDSFMQMTSHTVLTQHYAPLFADLDLASSMLGGGLIIE